MHLRRRSVPYLSRKDVPDVCSPGLFPFLRPPCIRPLDDKWHGTPSHQLLVHIKPGDQVPAFRNQPSVRSRRTREVTIPATYPCATKVPAQDLFQRSTFSRCLLRPASALEDPAVVAETHAWARMTTCFDASARRFPFSHTPLYRRSGLRILVVGVR